MLNEIIEKIIDESNASVQLPVTERELTLCQKNFKEKGIPPIPAGYVEFLKEANGLSWNGFEFYGTLAFSNDSEEEDIINLLQANEDFSEAEPKILLGQSEDELYIYNCQSKKYEVTDPVTGEEIESYSSFEDFFTDLMENVLSSLEDEEFIDEDDFDFYEDEE